MGLLQDIRQRHVESYFRTLRESEVDLKQLSSPEYCGQVVRAAVIAGIVTDIKDVGEMVPKEVIEMSVAVNDLIAEAIDFKKKA